MQLPTDTEIAAAKADAIKRFGREEALLVTLSDPIDFALLVAPIDRRAFAQVVDDQRHDGPTAPKKIVLSQLLWPAVDLVLAQMSRRATMARKAWGRLHARAGFLEGEPRVQPLESLTDKADPKVDPKAIEVIPGLTVAAARALLDAPVPEGTEPREFWAAWGPHRRLSVVFATPDADAFLAAESAELRAVQRKERIVEASLDFVIPSIVWSREPIDALLEDLPALGPDLRDAYKAIGGEGAEASCKSL